MYLEVLTTSLDKVTDKRTIIGGKFYFGITDSEAPSPLYWRMHSGVLRGRRTCEGESAYHSGLARKTC